MVRINPDRPCFGAAIVVAVLMLTACAPLAPQAERTTALSSPTPAAACPVAPACPVCAECAVPSKPAPASRAHYEPVEFAALPGWQAQRFTSSLRAFLTGCARLTASSPLAAACSAARATSASAEDAARRFFETAFAAYRVVSGEGSDEGLVTGYYEPVLAGSREQNAANRYPIHGVPEDLIVVDLGGQYPELRDMRLRGRIEGRRLVPYFSRAEIDAKGTALRAPVIAWAADPVELFFLHIQGSGQVELASGERLRIGYAEQNGFPFRSTARYLIDRGELKLEQASMQGIKAWAAANPAKLQDALNANASYVFFRALPAEGGPIGALGAPLTSEYSIAVDRRYYPLGAPVHLATTYPLSERALERLAVAQDVGGAIRGAVRADFFWGTGPEAGNAAGRMRQRGRMWLLWPRGEPLPQIE
jgi:membrane-bound lytic murein transglycosylase A